MTCSVLINQSWMEEFGEFMRIEGYLRIWWIKTSEFSPELI